MQKKPTQERVKGQYRQGDVLLTPVAELPPDTEKLVATSGRHVLAEGSATGHHHSVDAAAADLLASGTRRFVVVRDNTPLTHEEHMAIPLGRKAKEVVRQREYTPNAIRNVAD